jgi:hypothetical protein
VLAEPAAGSGVDLAQLIRKLQVPAGFIAPTELRHDEVVAHALTREHLADDVRGINASIELIRRTRGGRWPEKPVTEDFNYVDLVWHELEFREQSSFTYALYDSDATYLGCAYLYPMGRRRPLSRDLLVYDVDVSWWVTPSAYDRGLYAKAYQALRRWAVVDYPFSAPLFSNVELP